LNFELSNSILEKGYLSCRFWYSPPKSTKVHPNIRKFTTSLPKSGKVFTLNQKKPKPKTEKQKPKSQKSQIKNQNQHLKKKLYYKKKDSHK